MAYDRMVKIVETLMERGVVKEDGGLLCITPEGSSSSTSTDSGGGS